MDIKRIIFHDWLTDPYALCGPAYYRPGYITKYLPELQKRHGNVLMANADWAHGWRSFIEGAMEQGGLAADIVMREIGIVGANEVLRSKV
jgi:monoamine oxidase